MADLTQDGRFLKFTSPLGKDALLINELNGSEHLSSLYSYEYELIAPADKDPVNHDNIVGKQVTVSMDLKDGKFRYITGVVKRFAEIGLDNNYRYYRLEAVPWLWMLTLRSDCRIFQFKSVIDVIKEVFDAWKGKFAGVVDYKDATTGQHEKWDYITQYRETDFNFVSRLMEHEGIFYFFEHTDSGHKLVFADEKAAHQPLANAPKISFSQLGGTGEWTDDVITSLRFDQSMRPGKYTLRDYHFQLPSSNLEKKEPSKASTANDFLELYDFPGEYAHIYNKPPSEQGEASSKADPQGEQVSKWRMQEQDSSFTGVHGESTSPNLLPGFRFELLDGPKGLKAKKFIITSVSHTASQHPGYQSGWDLKESYRNSFTCIPLDQGFTPPRVTPKPVVQGPHVAVVVGPSGEEIYVDEYGRVKVQFPWDRLGSNDDKSSCWCRVSQPWGGAQWGAMWIPRIGQEVIVEFLEGDPSHPIITGRVYNANVMPPYTLPDKKTVSTFKSRSSPQGGDENYNELRFEDKKGSEQIFINAEKDLDLNVENDTREAIKNNRHLVVTQNQVEQIGADKHLHVKANHFEAIDSDMHLAVKGVQNVKITGKQSLNIGSDKMEQITGASSLKVGGDVKEQVGGGVSLQVGSSMNEKVGATWAKEAVQTVHIKAGMTLILEAGMQLSLKGPGGFVDIGPSGVSIQGTMVLINSGGAAGSGPGASPQSPDAPTDPTAPKDPDVADTGSKFGTSKQQFS